MPYIYKDIYGKEQVTLSDRQQIAGEHPELLLYLMTVSRFDRTGSITGQEPLGHLILASYLNMVGWDVRVFAGNIYDALALLEQRAADDANRNVLIGLYCDYENIEAVSGLAGRIKAILGYPILMGGPQAVALGEDFVRKHPYVDAVLHGDGEYAVSDLLSAYACGNPEARFSIRGVCCLDGDRCVNNGVSEPLLDLNEAPPVRDTVMIRCGRRTALAALSGRGCPFRCAFCYEGGNSKTVRLRSVDHMMNELKLRFADHPEAKYVYFGDDTFTLNKDRLSDFCTELRKLREERDYVWFADGHVRVLLAHPEYLSMMKNAGLVRMQIGIESTVQSIIDLYQKNIKKEDLYRIVDLCLTAELPHLVGNIIIGGAMETKETIRETFETVYELLRRSKGMLEVTSTLYSHFPGTAISADPKSFGLDIQDPEGLCSFGDYPIAETPGLNRDQIAALRREFIVETARVMKACVAEGQVDEGRMLTNMYLSKHYGLSGLWISFGLTRTNRRYYELKCEYGCEFDQLTDPMEMIPIRNVFILNEQDYVREIPSVSGFVLSPLEDDLLRWGAGKLTCREIFDKLWSKWRDSYQNREEFEQFAIARLRSMEKRRLLVFTELEGSKIARAFRNGTGVRERKLNGLDKDKKGKVLLFYPYTIGSVTDRDITGSTLGIFILGAVLKREGYEVKVCESIFTQIMDIVAEEDDGTVRAIGMSIDYENRRLTLRLCKAVTEKYGIPVILGGVDARTLTRDELFQCGAAVAIKGEGELTLPRVIACLNDPAALAKISGLLLIRDGELVDTGAEELPMELDRLPFADYSLSRNPVPGDMFYILTSRGCPNRCAFCHEGTHKTKLRIRSIPNVLGEVRSLLDAYPKLAYLAFCDDTLVTSVDRVRELCEGLKEIQKTRSFEWYCEADVLSLYRHPELLPMMIDAGLVRLQIGIESGDDELLRLYEKNLTADMVREVVKHAYDCGLNSMVGPLLIGAPFENPEHIEREKAWVEELIRLAPGMIELPGSIICPYPQTKIGQNPGRYGYTFTDDRGDGSNSDYPCYYTERMTEKDILAGYQAVTLAGVLASRAVIDEGLVPYWRLKTAVDLHMRRKSGVWGKILSSVYPMIYSYFQLTLSCGIPPIRAVEREELSDWHMQRTFEIWRFVNMSGAAPKIGKYVLSPYEYQLILYCAGKLTVRQIAERMYERFSGGDSREDFLNRILDTLLFFETKYWIVGVPY